MIMGAEYGLDTRRASPGCIKTLTANGDGT
jgi:hypothetical protein